jgi:hypothetical protein
MAFWPGSKKAYQAGFRNGSDLGGAPPSLAGGARAALQLFFNLYFVGRAPD